MNKRLLKILVLAAVNLTVFFVFTDDITHAAIDDEEPTASIYPEDESVVSPTAEIVITVNDNTAVDLGTTSYTVEKDGSDYSANCTSAGDGTASATITCADSGGGLGEGSYDVSVTPGDLAGNVGTDVPSAFTISSVAPCTNTVTISPASASVCVTGTQTFTASTACNGTSVTETYTWSAAECTSQGVLREPIR